MAAVSIEQSAVAVERWVEERGYKGYDPGDGLTSFLRVFTVGNIFAERVLQQLIWKAPINLRPFVGVVPLDSTKGRGFMAWGYLKLFQVFGEETYLEKAIACLEWLDQAREPGYAGHCWGNHFDFTTRTGRMLAHTPTIVWSGLIGQAFVEAYEVTKNEKFMDIAESICRWVLTLPRERTSTGDCLSYTGVEQSSVHNSNLLGAGLLIRTWQYRAREEYLSVARAAVEYSCARQLPDGAWWYGEEAKHHWIDNFHTAYNLDSIKRYLECTDNQTYRPALDLGYFYFKKTFFDQSGRPGYYHNQAYPIDIQCAAQAIDTFSFFAESDDEARGMAEKVAAWTIENMQSPTGYFYYRKYPAMTARTPYFHWGQATMFKALSHLLVIQQGSRAVSTPLASLTT